MQIRDIINKENDDLILALSYLINKPKSFIYSHPDHVLENRVADKMIEIEDKIKISYPLQYAIGQWEFYGLLLNVDPRALIPRFETELIVEHIINSSYKKDEILDIGSGSGAISLALANSLPNSKIIGVDISNDALSLAKENKEKLNLSNVTFIESDLFTNIDQKFDIIVSNPPYISPSDYENLDKKLYHEPKLALVGGDDGLLFYKKIIDNANSYLNENGHLIFEIGYDQKNKINDLLVKYDFKNIENYKDYSGFDRYIAAEKG